jgi:hypothetical protein
VYALADGFSPLTPVLFEVGSGIDDSSVHAPEAMPYRAFDLDTSGGDCSSCRGRPPGTGATQSSRVLAVWPRTSFPAGHRVAVGVTGGTDARESRDPAARPATYGRGAGAGRAGAAVRQLVFAYVGRIVHRAIAGRHGPLVDPLIAATQAADHPVRNKFVSPSLFGGAAQVTVRSRSVTSETARVHPPTAPPSTSTGSPAHLCRRRGRPLRERR